MYLDTLVRSALTSADTARKPPFDSVDPVQAVAYFSPVLGDGDNPAISVTVMRRFVDGFMVRAFNKQFFSRPLKDFTSFDSRRVRALHELGYLPVEVRTVPEGVHPAMGIPMLEMRNTDVKFAWIVDALSEPLSVVASPFHVPPGFCSVQFDRGGMRCVNGLSMVVSRMDKSNIFRQVFINGRMTPLLDRVR